MKPPKLLLSHSLDTEKALKEHTLKIDELIRFIASREGFCPDCQKIAPVRWIDAEGACVCDHPKGAEADGTNEPVHDIEDDVEEEEPVAEEATPE